MQNKRYRKGTFLLLLLVLRVFAAVFLGVLPLSCKRRFNEVQNKRYRKGTFC